MTYVPALPEHIAAYLGPTAAATGRRSRPGVPAERVDRLIERHIRHGKTYRYARDWVLRSDEANAYFIAATRGRADLVIRDVGGGPTG